MVGSGSKSIGIVIGQHVIVLLSAGYVRLVREKEKVPVRPFQFNRGILIIGTYVVEYESVPTLSFVKYLKQFALLLSSVHQSEYVAACTAAGNYGRAVENIETTDSIAFLRIVGTYASTTWQLFCSRPPTTIKSSIDYTHT